MSSRYVLEGKLPILCEDLVTWAKWLKTADRHVAKSESDGILVSTVFLGLDHSFDGSTPVLFETMIFGGEHDQYQERYHTWDEAERGHAEACTLAGIK